jgi:hypothetical protein
MYNVTLRHVRVSIAAVEEQAITIKYVSLFLFLHFFCVRLHYLWHVWLYDIFRLYLISGTIFGQKFIEHKMF